MSHWFATWFDTEYYHLLYNHRNETEANRFITNILNYLALPHGSRILDIACGKGRHAKAIADRGYQVTGIDLSTNSIQEASQLSKDDLHFFVHDMREPFAENQFDAGFNFFTSFGYFETEAEHLQAAEAFVKNLKPGGLLLIDFVNKQHALNNIQQHPSEIQQRGDIVYDIERVFENNRYVKRISVCDTDKCALFQESLKALTKADFIRYFEPLGVNLEKTFGDYQLNAYSEIESPRLILLFRKK